MIDYLIVLGIVASIAFLGMMRLTVLVSDLSNRIEYLKSEITRLSHINKAPKGEVSVTDLAKIRRLIEMVKNSRLKGGVELYIGIDQELPSLVEGEYIYKGMKLTPKEAEEVFSSKFNPELTQ